MDKRSLLDVSSRVLGLWQILLALDDAVTYVNIVQKSFQPLHEAPSSMLVFVIVHLIAGVFLLFSAPMVVHFVYGKSIPGGCPNCGYDLRATPERCPECGTETLAQPPSK